MAPELDRLLSGSLVDRISMSDRNTLHLALFTVRKSKFNLTLSAAAARPTLILSTDSSPQGLNPPPSFAMFLRKHLRRARIDSITTPPWERIFNVNFSALDELGDPVNLRLIFECMPRTANLVLVNSQDVILAVLRPVDHSVNRFREMLPAHPYIPPPVQDRLNPTECASLETDSLLGELTDSQLSGRALAGRVAGFSPILGQEVISRAGPGASREQVAEALRILCLEIAAGHYCPAVYYDGPWGNPLAAHAVRLSHLPVQVLYDDTYKAVADYSQAVAAIDRFRQRQQAITKTMEAHLKRTQKKRQLHEADVATGKEAASDRLMGELILAWIHTIPPGTQGLTLDNYRDPGKQVYCPLNPRLSPAENANLYFRKAKRKERKLGSARRFLQEDLDELAWLESLLAAAGYAETGEDLLAVEREYHQRSAAEKTSISEAPPAAGMPGKPASKKRRQQPGGPAGRKTKKTLEKQESLPGPRLFRSADGFLIASGRNNLQNDQLLRKAGRDDLWFHVKNFAGSHVILSKDGRPLTPLAIEEAAAVAAWYSGAGRGGGAVEVDYCPVRQVKKIPGTRPGKVTYSDYKTLYIKPADPSHLKIT